MRSSSGDNGDGMTPSTLMKFTTTGGRGLRLVFRILPVLSSAQRSDVEPQVGGDFHQRDVGGDRSTVVLDFRFLVSGRTRIGDMLVDHRPLSVFSAEDSCAT